MKKKTVYVAPQCEIICFSSADVITLSAVFQNSNGQQSSGGGTGPKPLG